MYKDPNDERAKASRRKHYSKNKKSYYQRNEIKRHQLREYLREIKNKPCLDCGIQYPFYVMEFDHRDPNAKLRGVTKLVNNCNMKKLTEEIEKCDVVCANCHRIRTWNKETGVLKYRDGIRVIVDS